MKDKKELVYDLAGALVAILFGCVVVIMIIANLPNSTELDGALIANVLTGGVTLFAPIAAYYLLSDWKEQFKFSKKVDFILEIRAELRLLEDELFELRNYHPLDLSSLTDYLNYEEKNKYFNEAMQKYLSHIIKIRDIFEDLHFLLNTKDKERNNINNKLNNLVSYSILAKRAHKIIFNAIENKNEDINITQSFAKCRAAYDALYDGPDIETTEGKFSYNEGDFLLENIKSLKDSYYEIYENGYSRNRSLMNRLLD